MGRWGRRTRFWAAGRYDGLAELLGSPQPAPGIGFAIGEDRLVMALQARASEAAPRVWMFTSPLSGKE